MGWLASVLLLAGHWQLGHKRRSAFLLTLAGDVLWCWVAVQRGTYDLLLICVASVCVQLRNWRKWGE